MKINLIVVGKMQQQWQLPFQNYGQKINYYATLKVLQIKESQARYKAQRIAQETQLILQAIPQNTAVFLCSRAGQVYNSDQFATLFTRNVTFVIGGSDGVDEDAFSEKIQFSALTFPHQLFRVILAEQIFRALNINKGTPYHK